MQLPIDLKKLFDEMTDIKAARACELSVSIYFDDKAPADVVAHVRAAFASTAPALRLTVTYLDDSFVPHSMDDMAVIVAGSSRGIGAAAAAVRSAGVPVAVVTTLPSYVLEKAGEIDYGIPEGDLIAPVVKEGDEEPLELTDERAAELDERLGRWIVAVCNEKRLAMAMAFPFMRRTLAKEAVATTSLQNAGIGLVPLIPGAELPVMTLNQAKMVMQIAAAYGQEMDRSRVKELAAVVGAAYLCRTVARSLVEFVPVLGFVIKPGIAYGGTSAVGHAAIEYFEGGQDAAGVRNVASRAVEAGTKLVTDVREKGPDAVPGLWDKLKGAAEYVPVVKDKAKEYAPKAAAVVNDVVGAVVAASKTEK